MYLNLSHLLFIYYFNIIIKLFIYLLFKNNVNFIKLKIRK